MIIQEQGDQLVLIRQTDHAVLSGFFAREWGNEQFTRPEPFASFCLAAAEHDNGWREWELLPGLDLKTRLPYSFTSIPTEEHIALYQRGIERLIKIDHYAGLLVSMHCAELYNRTRATLPGFSALYVKASESQLANEFVQRLRLQQLRLKVDLHANPPTKNFADEKTLQANYQRLEALDRLSLYFCLAPLDVAIIDQVPMDDAGGETDWDLRPAGGNLVRTVPRGRSIVICVAVPASPQGHKTANGILWLARVSVPLDATSRLLSIARMGGSVDALSDAENYEREFQ